LTGGLLLTGCAPSIPVGTVSGTVSFDGKAYDESALIFLDPSTGQAASVDIAPGGTFAFEQPLQVGTYNIYLAPKSVPDESAEPSAVKVDSTVPPKYWNESTTDITAPVVEGTNTITVELKKA